MAQDSKVLSLAVAKLKCLLNEVGELQEELQEVVVGRRRTEAQFQLSKMCLRIDHRPARTWGTAVRETSNQQSRVQKESTEEGGSGELGRCCGEEGEDQGPTAELSTCTFVDDLDGTILMGSGGTSYSAVGSRL